MFHILLIDKWCVLWNFIRLIVKIIWSSFNNCSLFNWSVECVMLSFQRKERERKTKYKTLRRFLRWCKFEYKQTNKKTLPETFGGTLCCCYWFICLLCGEESLPRSALRTYLSQHIKSNRMCQTQWNVTQKSLHRLHYLICLIVSVGRFWWSSFGAITSHMHFTFCFFFFCIFIYYVYLPVTTSWKTTLLNETLGVDVFVFDVKPSTIYIGRAYIYA